MKRSNLNRTDDLAMQLEVVSARANKGQSIHLRTDLRTVAVALVLFAAVLLLQWRTGAFSAEFSGYPDEASHYVSGLLAHDYVLAGLPREPMRFAQNFYLHYPYLAIGHWPPAFYAIEGAWMLLFSPSRVSVMMLMVVITSALAFTVYKLVYREFGTVSAGMVAGLLICCPLVLQYTAMVMLESLLALFSLWAAVYFGRFIDQGRWQDSGKFAVFASLAIMTKANGFELALVPAFVLLLTRRFYFLRRWSFWVPGLFVALVALPWHLATLHLMLPTFTADAGIRFTVRALSFFTAALVPALGSTVLILSVLGVVVRIVKPYAHNGVEGKWAVLASLAVSVIVFHSIFSGGLERRYLVTALAPILMFSAAGAMFVVDKLPFPALNPLWRQNIVLAASFLIFIKMTFAWPPMASPGFKDAAARTLSAPSFKNGLILVSSETNVGEGIFVSEIAMRDHGLNHVVLRASKVLADNSWNQSLDPNYRPLFPDSQSVRKCLELSHIRFVVLDTSPGPKTYEHHQQLSQMLREHHESWRLIGSYGARGAVRLYASVGDDSVPDSDPLQRIRTNLDSKIRNWPITERLTCPGEGEAEHARASR